jgi:hypothetical protein
MTDTVLSEGKSDCLLLAGLDLQLSPSVTHLSTEILGSNATEFDIKRLLKLESNISLGDATKEAEPEQKRAYFPFSGGKNLCPKTELCIC